VWTEAAPSPLATAPAPATLVAASATIQAAVAASQERQRAASLALDNERATGAALTAQLGMKTVENGIYSVISFFFDYE
jgi:hypothetical protein